MAVGISLKLFAEHYCKQGMHGTCTGVVRANDEQCECQCACHVKPSNPTDVECNTCHAIIPEQIAVMGNGNCVPCSRVTTITTITKRIEPMIGTAVQQPSWNGYAGTRIIDAPLAKGATKARRDSLRRSL